MAPSIGPKKNKMPLMGFEGGYFSKTPLQSVPYARGSREILNLVGPDTADGIAQHYSIVRQSHHIRWVIIFPMKFINPNLGKGRLIVYKNLRAFHQGVHAVGDAIIVGLPV